MAVTCPDCGRGYDVTLFQFGRTIECTCGARVGRAPPERNVVRGPDTRFLCDAMLGRLARWLRALGYDTSFDPHADDEDVARSAVREERFVLTKDRSLPDEWRVGGCLVLEDDAPLVLLRRVHERLGLGEPPGPFTRCLACNGKLEPASEEAVEARVPARAREKHEAFRQCPGCGRVYWEGSHVRRMRGKLEAALGVTLRTPGTGDSEPAHR